MHDTLSTKIKKYKQGIMNLNSSNNTGTHWVAYCKVDKEINYYDSCIAVSPLELVKYFGNAQITYNNTQEQQLDAKIVENCV